MKNISHLLQLAAYFASLALIGGIPGLAMPLEDSALGSVNRLIGGLVTLLWLLSVVARGRLGKLHLFHLLAVAFAVWYVISVWWSVAPDETPFTVNLIEGVVLSIMLWDIYRTQERLEAAMQAFLLGGYVSIAMTASNFAQGQQVRHWEQRFSGSGFDPNDIALLLAIGIPMSTYLATRPTSPSVFRLLNLLYPLATALGIILSGSRGALLAAAPAYLFYLLRMTRLSRGWGVAMAGVLMVALTGVARLDLSAPLQRLGTVAESSGDDHLSGRSDIWQAGWNAFGEHPFLGVGGGAFSMATKGKNGQVLALIAHNTYLSVLTELGPIGFLLFLALVTLVVQSALRQESAMREMSLLALLVWGIGVFALSWEFRSQTWLLFGLIMAAGHCAPPAVSRTSWPMQIRPRRPAVHREEQGMKTCVLISGQDPSLPGGMAKYVGGLCAYLDTVGGIDPRFLNETQVKGRVGMMSTDRLAAVRESGRLLRSFQSSLRRHRPDVVHLHMAHGLSVLEKSAMAAMAARAGVPAVIHLHGAGLDIALAAMPAWRRRWLDRALAPPHRVIALSGSMEVVLRKFLPSVRTSVIPNAVHLVTPPPPLASPPTFGFLGFMDGRKGECDLLQAVARSGVPHCDLLLAGDGPMRPRAEALTARLGLADRAHFLGNIDGAAKDAFFRQIDVLCLPSQAENLPIALLEAMGYGRPVITTPVGGIPDMVTDGAQGWLTPPGHIESLAATLTEAAGDPEEVQRRGRAAWQTVADRFTWERNGPRVVSLYQNLHTDSRRA